MYYFTKYKDKWMYRKKGWVQAIAIDTFALERVLGVIGGPEVIVIRKQDEGDVCHITLKNGFIDSVESVTEQKTWDTVEGFEITGTQQCRVPVEKFHAQEIPL